MRRLVSVLLIAVASIVGPVSLSPAKPLPDRDPGLATRSTPVRLLPRYVVEPLQNPVPDDPLKPRGINERGDVTGFVNYPYDAFVALNRGGTTLLADLPRKTHGFGWEINDAGQVAGSSGFETIQPPERAVRWTNGAPQDLGTLGTDSRAYSLNNLGHAVGMSYVGGNSHAFFWSEPSGMIDLTPTMGFSTAYDVNEDDYVTGSGGDGRAFRWHAGALENLGAPSGYTYSAGFAINERNQVAGYVKTASGNSERFARYTDAAGWEVLGGSGQNNKLWGLNDRGDAVGTGNSGGFQMGYVYLEGLGLYRLDDLVATHDWTILSAWDINNSGVIAAYASAIDGSGRMGAVRLRPLTLQSDRTTP